LAAAPAAAPPAAGKCPDAAEVDAVDVVAREMESPITANIIAVAAIHPLLLFDSNRRSLSQRPCLAVAEADGSGVALEPEPAGRGSPGLVGL
jgi:predicted short-subunit dehydrogenase-like oxidoreductase (DUF2520 family)